MSETTGTIAAGLRATTENAIPHPMKVDEQRAFDIIAERLDNIVHRYEHGVERLSKLNHRLSGPELQAEGEAGGAASQDCIVGRLHALCDQLDSCAGALSHEIDRLDHV